jgi:DNA repair photolyase
LEAVRKLNRAGIRTGVSCAPVIPGITDSPKDLDKLVKAVSSAGGKHIFANPLFLKPCSAAVFMPFLKEKFPHLADNYTRRYADRAYLPKTYHERISQLMRKLRDKYKINSRMERTRESIPHQLLSDEQLNLF